MARRLWTEYGNYIQYLRNDETFIMKEEDFNRLKKLYHFKTNTTKDLFYDPKRNKIVAHIDKDILNNNEKVIYFSKFWLYNEALTTGIDWLVNILKNSIECYDIYKEYAKIKRIDYLDMLSYIDKSIYKEHLMKDNTDENNEGLVS